MDGIAIVRNRINGIAATVTSLVDELSDCDWSTPVRPGTSPIGLTLWHLPRTQDWLVNTCIRAVDEVADGPSYCSLPAPEEFGFGTGLTPERASAAAANVKSDALVAYVDAVRANIDEWLAGLSDADLDVVVDDFAQRQQRRAAYSTPDALQETAHLGGLTVGVLLLRPAVSHVLMHLGEVDTLATIARAS